MAGADSKPGAKSLFQVSHADSGSQGPLPSSADFPGHKQEAGSEEEEPGSNQCPYGKLVTQVEEKTVLAPIQCFSNCLDVPLTSDPS